MAQERLKFSRFKAETDAELRIKEALIGRLEDHIKLLQKEILLSKHILKDPIVSKQVSRTFNQHIAAKTITDRLVKDGSMLGKALEDKEYINRNTFTFNPGPNKNFNSQGLQS